jgi:hypothetical protein
MRIVILAISIVSLSMASRVGASDCFPLAEGVGGAKVAQQVRADGLVPWSSNARLPNQPLQLPGAARNGSG